MQKGPDAPLKEIISNWVDGRRGGNGSKETKDIKCTTSVQFRSRLFEPISILQKPNWTGKMKLTSVQAPSDLSCAAPTASIRASAVACGRAHKEEPEQYW